MNYLKSFVQSNEENAPSGSETVARLCDRISSSTLLEDRRDAVRALKSLSKKFRLEVGSQALPQLIEVLTSDYDDEIASYSLDTLFNLTTVDDDGEGNSVLDPEIAASFVDKFTEVEMNINIVLDMVEKYEFSVRWAAVKLLTSLLRGKATVVQNVVLAKPMGISCLMDLLTENREIIRNDV
uniref:Uncharacterized protein n=1 Tax=Ciona intestinalis TaxID=7719 RepID=F6W9R3_CIOIN